MDVVIGPYGFCFGVQNAVETIEKLLKQHRVYTDGDVVHNRNVVERLKKMGLSLIELEKLKSLQDENAIFVVRAHGLPPDNLEIIRRYVRIEDLTCSIVRGNIERAKNMNLKGYKVVAFGDEHHAEMVTLKGNVPDVIITKEPVSVAWKKIFLMSQTTSSSAEFKSFVDAMKEVNKSAEVVVYDSVCKVTVEREHAAKRLAEICDVVLIIGGKNSANTRKLYDIVLKVSRAKPVHIEDKHELEHMDLSSAKSVGVISGTSTSTEDVEEVLRYLSEKYGGRERYMAEYNRDVSIPTEEELSFEELLNQAELSETRVRRGAIVEATVIEVSSTGVTLDLGSKLTGILPPEEAFRELSEYKVGEKIKVRIERISEEDGTAEVSEKRPMERIVREQLEQAFKNGTPVFGKIMERTKGGYKVLLSKLFDAFLPGSESAMRPDEQIPAGNLEFVITSMEQRGRKLNIVVSRKRIFERMIDEFFSTKKLGDVVEGIVESIDNRGAFVKIGGILNAFVPNSEISYNSNLTPKDVLTVGKSFKFVIKEIDVNRRRVTLSLKALLPDPWESVPKKFSVGQTVSGIVTSIKPFGFFVKLEDGVEGLVPISEVFWGKPGKIEDLVAVGDAVKLQIIDIRPDKRQITLSYKNALGDPWQKVEEKYLQGNLVSAKVVKILPNGAILELEPNITAFCNISELSWNFVDNPEEVIQEGQKVNVRIMEVDKENKKIRVSIKRASENPWEKFAQNHKEGDVVTARIIKVVDKGYIGLCEGVEVYIPKTQVYDELEIGAEVSGKIIKLEQQKDIYKIVVSPKVLESEKAVRETQRENLTPNVKLEIKDSAEVKAEDDTNSGSKEK